MTTDLFGTSPAIPCGTASTKHHGRRALTLGIAASAAIAMFLGGMGSTASADPSVFTATVGSAITLSNVTATFGIAGIPGATVEGLAAVHYNVATNNLHGYSVQVTAAAPTMIPPIHDPAPENPDSILIGALSVRLSGETPWKVMNNGAGVTVKTQATRSVLQAGDAWTDDYQLVIPFVNEDTYSVTLDYIATELT